MTELLAPAGEYEIGITALNYGADALYLALKNFGARAYAKNFTYEELENIVNYANVLGKKIYVTCNTLIKDSELNEVYEMLNKIYQIGVHGVISTDYAVINYIINNLPDMECHISTQVGVKALEDTLYFDELGSKRCVLAREVNLDEIKRIKENSKMPIEVFIHGALCVSYSGNCFFSSLLTLRSGNRGRCSQNCRREYQLIKDDKIISDKLYLLSTKDLNSFNTINTLKDLGVDSLKIEGRMKDVNYVKTLVYAYRNKLDNKDYSTSLLDKIFHRTYTEGFLKNEDRGKLVSSNRPGNVGEYIGKLTKGKNDYYKLILKSELNLGDRIRLTLDKDYYFDVENLFDINLKPTTKLKNNGYIKLNIKIDKDIDIYIIKNRNINIEEPSKIGLSIYLSIKDNDLLIYANYNDNYINLTLDNYLDKALTRGLTYNDIYKQLAKLNDTPFYLETLEVPEEINNYFLPISKINELRRILIKHIYDSLKPERKILEFSLPKLKEKKIDNNIYATVRTSEQLKACEELGIKVYHDDNYLNYNEVKKLDNNDLLVSNYGSIYLNKDKELTLNKEFNVFNHHSLAYFLQVANSVTLSQELSYSEIKDLVNNFYNHYGFMPNCDYIIYGKMTLMTLKYCPIKHMGLCNECKTNQFYLKDNNEVFPLIQKNCITSILNSKTTNLIDEIKNLKPYIKRFRLDFTIENYEECKKALMETIRALNGVDTNFFNNVSDTRAYYKRKVI